MRSAASRLAAHVAARVASAARTSREVGGATLSAAWDDRILGLSAEAGFWSLLSMTPLMLVLLSAIGYLAPLFGPQIIPLVRAKILHAAGKFLVPDAVHSVLTPILNEVTQQDHVGLLSVGTLIALWTGSTAMSTYVNTITIAYDMRGIRSAVRSRILAFLMYLGSLVVGTITLPLLIIVPGWALTVVPLHIQPAIRPFVTYGYWPAVIVVCTVAITVLYHFAVPISRAWRLHLPGAIAAMALWLASSYLLRTYLTYAIAHSPTYGAMAAPVASLLFLYVTGLALLLGAELNAQIRHRHKARKLQAHGEQANPTIPNG
ncbi:MAG: YihY/virulence factor BrkB family protein [Streptosporangiales bacterium]|nr:YihY/virulence factor BrkB family protein [Streptosporangiales bacterium]